MERPTLEGLEARIAELEARLALIELEAEYARTWDTGDDDAWAALFTEDGVLELPTTGAQPGRTVKGRHALAAFCREIDALYKGLHFMHLPRLHVDGDIARGRLHFQWLGLYASGALSSGRRQAFGYYDVIYRRVDGRWHIAQRLDKAVATSQSDSYGL